jgi:hypothetical protein
VSAVGNEEDDDKALNDLLMSQLAQNSNNNVPLFTSNRARN